LAPPLPLPGPLPPVLPPPAALPPLPLPLPGPPAAPGAGPGSDGGLTDATPPGAAGALAASGPVPGVPGTPIETDTAQDESTVRL
jgi:hypothetical protein